MISINEIIEKFIQDLKLILDQNILSVIFYGSMAFDDFFLGYSDLDFLVVTKEEMSEIEIKKLSFLYKRYHLNAHNKNFMILEGHFLSINMLIKHNISEVIIEWSHKKERMVNRKIISKYTILSIKTKGKVLFGEDILSLIPMVSKREVFNENREYLKKAFPFIKISSSIHMIDWFFIVSSMIYYLENNQLISKSHAALWAYETIKMKWTKIIPKCIVIRQNPHLFEISEYKNWVLTLEPYLEDLKHDIKKRFMI